VAKKRRAPPAAPPADHSASRPTRARGRWVPVGVAAIVLAAAGWVAYRHRYGSFPAPPTFARATPVAFSDFAGADSCAACHAREYALWRESTHGHAGGAPTPDRIIAPFTGQPMRFQDAVVTPSRTADGGYVFTVAQRDHPPQEFRVAAVVGGGLMAGGGTQTFFAKFPDGTTRFLPFDFSRSYNGWFCNTASRLNRGLIPVSPALPLAACGDWPPTRVLGSYERFESCQQCHGSQIELAFDAGAKQYVTRYTTLAINCESCHGPGRRHIELARTGHLGDGSDIGMRALATLSKEQSVRVCFQCHAVKVALEAGYLPGARLERHFALKFGGLLDTLYFADGRTREFAYQEGHLSSDCYLNGSMTCVDCHDPHSQRYRDINGRSLPGRFDDGQCLDCHASKADHLERHTHHPVASAGSRCTSCHMPYLQEPSAGPTIRYARSDHSISIPRPLYDSHLGIRDGCIQCHAGESAEHLDRQVLAWYGELKPHPAPLAAALAAEGESDRLAAARAAFPDDDKDPVAAFAALSAFAERFIYPDMPDLEPEIVQRLEARAGRPDVDLAALALATLHLARGSDPGVRRFLVTSLRAASDSASVLLRDRWSWTLRARGDALLAKGDDAGARACYSRAAEIAPTDAAVYRGLGVASTRLQDYPAATGYFARALALRPEQPEVLVDLAFALAQQGRTDSAIALYHRAVALNPWEESAFANLGLTLLGMGNTTQAIPALEQAVVLDPALAEARFALATAYQATGRRDEAIAALEWGLEFEPGNNGARQLLDSLVRGRAVGAP